MKITIQTIPHDQQRYSTTGDWEFTEDELKISVSEMKDNRYNLLVAFHELVEAVLCDYTGVSQAEVDSFDMAHPELDEPGDSKDAPYHQQHEIASMFEKNLSQYLVVNFKEYEEEIGKLYE